MLQGYRQSCIQCGRRTRGASVSLTVCCARSSQSWRRLLQCSRSQRSPSSAMWLYAIHFELTRRPVYRELSRPFYSCGLSLLVYPYRIHCMPGPTTICRTPAADCRCQTLWSVAFGWSGCPGCTTWSRRQHCCCSSSRCAPWPCSTYASRWPSDDRGIPRKLPTWRHVTGNLR